MVCQSAAVDTESSSSPPSSVALSLRRRLQRGSLQQGSDQTGPPSSWCGRRAKRGRSSVVCAHTRGARDGHEFRSLL